MCSSIGIYYEFEQGSYKWLSNSIKLVLFLIQRLLVLLGLQEPVNKKVFRALTYNKYIKTFALPQKANIVYIKQLGQFF